MIHPGAGSPSSTTTDRTGGARLAYAASPTERKATETSNSTSPKYVPSSPVTKSTSFSVP